MTSKLHPKLVQKFQVEVQRRVCLVHRAAEEEAATRRVGSEIFEFALGALDFHAALKCAEVSWFILFQQLCPPLKGNCSCSSGEIALSGSWFTSVVRISLPWLRGFGAIKIPSVTCCLLNDPLSLISVTELPSRTWEDIRLAGSVWVTQEVNDLM